MTTRSASSRLFVAATAVLLISGAATFSAFAETTVAPVATADALKLFPDSRMVVRERISVEVLGRGPDLVMIPGLASTRETWRATAERLRGRYRVHLVQVAGFGGEPARANASGPVFEPVAADIDAYLATLKRPIVLGHSLGGTLGLAIAQRHPERMQRLLVVDALPFFGVLQGGPSATPETVRPMLDRMMGPPGAKPMTMPAAQQRAMMASMVTAPADVERLVDWGVKSDPRVVMTAMRDDMLTDLRPGLAAMTTPTTVLYPWDPTLPYPEAMFTANYVGGYAPAKAVKVIRVDGSRHFIMYDKPERFAQEVDAFLSRR